MEHFKLFPGVLDEVFAALKQKVGSMRPEERQACLLMDDIETAPGLDCDASIASIIGVYTRRRAVVPVAPVTTDAVVDNGVLELGLFQRRTLEGSARLPLVLGRLLFFSQDSTTTVAAQERQGFMFRDVCWCEMRECARERHRRGSDSRNERFATIGCELYCKDSLLA
ncbi:hypothetical protein HPB47_004311, partial [Ixodes persulcatus]